jgi:hypothetical protein
MKGIYMKIFNIYVNEVLKGQTIAPTRSDALDKACAIFPLKHQSVKVEELTINGWQITVTKEVK